MQIPRCPLNSMCPSSSTDDALATNSGSGVSRVFFHGQDVSLSLNPRSSEAFPASYRRTAPAHCRSHQLEQSNPLYLDHSPVESSCPPAVARPAATESLDGKCGSGHVTRLSRDIHSAGPWAARPVSHDNQRSNGPQSRFAAPGLQSVRLNSSRGRHEKRDADQRYSARRKPHCHR